MFSEKHRYLILYHYFLSFSVVREDQEAYDVPFELHGKS